MTEQEIRNFISVVTDYFQEVTGEDAQIGVPYIKNEDSVLLDYTGAIGISGVRRGAVYLTAPGSLLRELGGIILGQSLADIDDEDLNDLVGEVTNTIAGNMRRSFGSDFMISVPLILQGQVSDIKIQLKPPVFIIPIQWKGHKCYLAIGLE